MGINKKIINNLTKRGFPEDIVTSEGEALKKSWNGWKNAPIDQRTEALEKRINRSFDKTREADIEKARTLAEEERMAMFEKRRQKYEIFKKCS